ncbi:MAG: anaerobic ribonucleoside-triphosphate reductase activating protein [Bacteroidales bacterium]
MTTRISLLKIIEDTTVDGPGFRTAIYGAGCSHHCKGCHNPLSWVLDHGKSFLIDDVLHQILSSPMNVTFSGGDPLFQVEAFTVLARLIKQHSRKNIWCYTGYLFEEILKSERLQQILPYIDVLVDGPYLEEKRHPDLIFRGSSNQRLIDVQVSVRQNEIILYEYNPFPHF